MSLAVRATASAEAAGEQKIRIKLRSYWTEMLADSVEKIRQAAVSTNARISGPVYLPTRCKDSQCPYSDGSAVADQILAERTAQGNSSAYLAYVDKQRSKSFYTQDMDCRMPAWERKKFRLSLTLPYVDCFYEKI